MESHFHMKRWAARLALRKRLKVIRKWPIDSKESFPNKMFCFSFEETLDRSPLNNAWKIYNFKKEKWYIFFTKKAVHKERWLKAFKDERRRVTEDAKTGKEKCLKKVTVETGACQVAWKFRSNVIATEGLSSWGWSNDLEFGVIQRFRLNLNLSS